MRTQYIYNKSIMGLKRGHEYEIRIERPQDRYYYHCYITMDYTSEKEVNILLPLTSHISIKQRFNLTDKDLWDIEDNEVVTQVKDTKVKKKRGRKKKGEK